MALSDQDILRMALRQRDSKQSRQEKRNYEYNTGLAADSLGKGGQDVLVHLKFR